MLYAFYRHACQANGGTLLAQSRNAPTAQLEATARDQNGNAMSAQFSWASSDTAVVTVDRTGLVTARIREGSFWYVHVSGSQRPSTAIRLRDLADRELSDDILAWIVRLR